MRKKRLSTSLLLLLVASQINPIAASADALGNTLKPTLNELIKPTFGGQLRNASDINSWMPDKNLQKIIENMLGLSQVDEITKELLANGNIVISDADTMTEELLPEIKDFTGLEYASNITFYLSGTADCSFESINGLLSPELKAITSFWAYKNLALVFPDGIDFSKFDDYYYVGIDPHNVYSTTHSFSLNDKNYTSFFLSFSDVKLSNVSDIEYIPEVRIRYGENKQLVYEGAVQDNGIKFTLDSSYSPDIDYAELAGQTFVTPSEDINYPTGPFTQIHFGNAKKTLGAYVNVCFAVTFGYEASDLTVKYQDTDGHEIATPQTLSGNIGDAYDVTTAAYKLDIPGYIFKEVQGQAIGTLTNQAQTVIFVYTKAPDKAKDLTLEYIDTDGKKIATAQTISGNVGDTYDITGNAYKQTILGYTFKEIQGQTTGTLSNQAQTVTFVYTKNPVKAELLTVRYHDTAGNKIADFKTVSGNIGDPYDVSTDAHKLDIEGHTLQEVHGQTTGVLTDKAQIVTYVYAKNPVKAKDLTVKYQNVDGKEIATAKTVSGHVGDAYDVSTNAYKQAINGYTFKEVTGQPIGKLTDKDQTVIYVYTKNTDDVLPQTGKTNQNTPTLPNTGDGTDLSVMLVGISLLFVTLMTWLNKFKVDKR
ncbi:MucBP domain-containing protein [Pseudolactococcus reticulitermitis]|uniref:MucBP domain-containing protein n=1 Tax=Pseudolactococcus reticulitermitis TaxID=2025039 RepID=A0A224X8Y5_9LACT|nr:MucBP domain-containing protein [Lactococcus reticulitermitis]GAX47730.1 hypothetical protein RsY01_1331 [Lactococcus reticulitermitis]